MNEPDKPGERNELMGLNSDDTVHPLLRHERAIATLEQKQEEHTKDNHQDLIEDVLDRLNNFQSDVFQRFDRAQEEQKTYLQELIAPVTSRLDDLESEVFPDGKEKESGSEEDGEDEEIP